MFDPSTEPRWMRGLSRLVLREGFVPSLVGLTVLVTALSVGLALLVVQLSGMGSPWLAVGNAMVCALVLTPAVGSFVLRLVFLLDAARRQQTVLAMQDPLTGVHNRRHFLQVAGREWARCRRYGEDGALLLIDADHFKSVNDTHGHLCGDALLCEIARIVGQTLRQPDLLARFGGEELIVYLPNTDPLGALDVAERIRERVAANAMAWNGASVRTSVSIGVASIGASHATLDALIHDADIALYAAKNAGRNAVRAAPIQPRAASSRPSPPPLPSRLKPRR